MVGTGRRLWTVSAIDGRLNPIDVRPDLRSPRWAAAGDAIYYLEFSERSLWRVPVNPESGKRAGKPRPVLDGLHATEFSLSRDGRRFAYARGPSRSNLWLMDLSPGSEAVALTAGTFGHGRARFSPDGSQIAFSRIYSDKRLLMVVPTSGGRPRRVEGLESCQYPVWSPDGSRIAVAAMLDGAQFLCTLASGGGDLRIYSEAGPPFSLDWRPAATILFNDRERRRFFLLDPEEGTVSDAGDGERVQWQARWAPDGKRYAVLETNATEPGDPRVVVYSLPDGGKREIYPGVATPIGWTPDGEHVFLATPAAERASEGVGGAASAARRIAIVSVPAAGGEPEPVVILPPLHLWSSIDVSPDASKLVYSRTEYFSDIWMIEDFDPAAH